MHQVLPQQLDLLHVRRHVVSKGLCPQMFLGKFEFFEFARHALVSGAPALLCKLRVKMRDCLHVRNSCLLEKRHWQRFSQVSPFQRQNKILTRQPKKF